MANMINKINELKWFVFGMLTTYVVVLLERQPVIDTVFEHSGRYFGGLAEFSINWKYFNLTLSVAVGVAILFKIVESVIHVAELEENKKGKIDDGENEERVASDSEKSE